MTETTAARRGPLHAVLRQVEANLYRAEHGGEINPENPDERAIPDYHIGTNPHEVKTWVEEMATGLGYDGVIWASPTEGRSI